MISCPELGRLPKARALRSLNFKHTTPGSVATALYPHTQRNRKILDPTHIAAKIPVAQRRSAFPHFDSDAFSLRALPRALLFQPEFKWPDPPFHYDPDRKIPGRLNMSLCREVAGHVHESTFARGKMVTKIKTAISLIVTRGAHVRKETEGRPTIIFDEVDAGEKWLLDGWSYSIRLLLPLHRMSYAELIPIMREALRTVKVKGDAMEDAWARGQLLPGRSSSSTTTSANPPAPTHVRQARSKSSR